MHHLMIPCSWFISWQLGCDDGLVVRSLACKPQQQSHCWFVMLQDHIVAGVLMTKRDTFLTRSEFMQLLYAACCPSRPGPDPAAAINIVLPPPALIAPRKLYTGKQVISCFTLRNSVGDARNCLESSVATLYQHHDQLLPCALFVLSQRIPE